MTHPTWELSIHNNGSALVLTPCPGTKGVTLEKSIKQLKEQGVTAIVTALSLPELKACGMEDLPIKTQEQGLRWFNAPIEDDCAPNECFLAQWKSFSCTLHAALDKGEKVALHCMGGSGRTGLLAAHLLLERDWSLESIIQKVQALRPGAFTKPVQISYIIDFSKTYLTKV